MPIKLTAGQYFGKEIKTLESKFVKCNLTYYSPFLKIEEHLHENSHLSFLVDGAYKEINDSGEEVLNPGNLIFRPGNYAHSNCFTSVGGKCLNIEFKENMREYIQLDGKLWNKTIIYKNVSFPRLQNLFYFFINDRTSDLFEYIVDWIFYMNNEPLFQHTLPWIGKVRAILEDELDQHHTIHSLAGRVFVHPVHLARAFKLKTGHTIGEYQQKLKMQKAIALLLTTGLPIKEIAISTGFYDSAHFIRLFKTLYRITPYQLRSRKLI